MKLIIMIVINRYFFFLKKYLLLWGDELNSEPRPKGLGGSYLKRWARAISMSNKRKHTLTILAEF